MNLDSDKVPVALDLGRAGWTLTDETAPPFRYGYGWKIARNPTDLTKVRPYAGK